MVKAFHIFVVLTISALSVSCSGGEGEGKTVLYKGMLEYPGSFDANVCIDENLNGYADDENCQTITNIDAEYSIAGSAGGFPLAAGIYAESAITAERAVEPIYDNVLSSPAESTEKISIFTTFIKYAMDADPAVKFGEAEKRVTADLNLMEGEDANRDKLSALLHKQKEALSYINRGMDGGLTADYVPAVMAEIMSGLKGLGSKTTEEIKSEKVEDLIQQDIFDSMEIKRIAEEIKRTVKKMAAADEVDFGKVTIPDNEDESVFQGKHPITFSNDGGKEAYVLIGCYSQTVYVHAADKNGVIIREPITFDAGETRDLNLVLQVSTELEPGLVESDFYIAAYSSEDYEKYGLINENSQITREFADEAIDVFKKAVKKRYFCKFDGVKE